MRISTSYQYDSYQQEIDAAQNAMYVAGQQVATGKRINAPSDDPFGIQTVLTAGSFRNGIAQYTANLNTAKGYLNFTEQALTDTGSLMDRANQLALSGANGATTQDGRNAMVTEISDMQSQLISLGNTRGASGQYIFGGQKNSTVPFTLAGTTLTYNGDGNNVTVETSPTSAMTVNTQGGTLYTRAYQQLETLKNDLTGGNLGEISGVDVPAVQATIATINNLRGAVGSKLQSITDLNSQYARRSDELTKSISDVQDVDVAKAITQYTQAQTAYQAALSVTGQLNKLSLLNYI